MPSPIALMAAASQVTERARLISVGVMLSLHPHPLRVAEELALVDNLSHGRLAPEFISATAQNLYAYNVSPEEERARYHEAYDLIVKAWTTYNSREMPSSDGDGDRPLWSPANAR